MSSVTARISKIKQPRGGYINPSMFVETIFTDGKFLFEEENIHASLIGMVVDYLTRFMSGTDLVDAFNISIQGAQYATLFGNKRASKEAERLLKGISGLDDNSIINACKLVTFDVWKRNPSEAISAKDYTEINPNSQTISNIRIMVQRGIVFWEQYGPVLVDGFTFDPKGYTVVVDSGDGDYLTADTIWDFKVSKSKPKNTHTLQLLMYWIMGQHSGKAEYKSITKLGIFNPRMNSAYVLEIRNVSSEVIAEVERDVICYK